MIVNNYGLQPEKDDKKLMVVRFVALGWRPYKNFKGGIYFSKLDTAQKKRREEILILARELDKKSFIQKLFF